jgi:replicative DNA helicase
VNAPVTDPLRPVDAEAYLVSLLTAVTRRALRDEALAQVEPQHFAEPMFEHMWRAARALRDDDRAVSARTVLGRMRDDMPQRSPRGHASVQRAQLWLETHAGQIPDTAGFVEAVSTVVRCGRLRRLVEVLDSVRHQAVEAEDPAQALSVAYEQLGKLDQEEAADEHVHSYSDLLDRFLDEQRNPGSTLLIATPWRDLNDILLGGLRLGRMYVAGGRPGDGKSISVLQMGHCAAEQGHHALVFSAEMGGGEVTDRLVSAGAVVEQSNITRRALTDEDWLRVGEYYNRARSLPIHVVDRSNLTLPYIKQVVRESKRRHNTKFVGLDYLQLIGSDRHGQQRQEEVAAISRGIKQLSRELDVSVLVAAQLNRSNVRENRRPAVADLRESGGIEADADVVILHWRPPIEEGDRKGEPGWTVEFDVAKNRVGRTGRIELDWRAHYATIGSPSQAAAIEGN